MSSLAWIDFDEAERQRVQRIMALFKESESRDELGMGAIRDSISDHLFPGTSTIQTRLRYMLFIPWLYRELENRGLPEAKLRAEARNLEVRFVKALEAGGESTGVIGSSAGARLQRLPSSVYWAGLGAWGIRRFHGSIDSLFPVLETQRVRRENVDREDRSANSQGAGIWHPNLPEMPADLLDRAVFRLRNEEAQFIIDRLVATQPKALLTVLASDGVNADCEHIWTHPNLADFPKPALRLVQHGEIFSQVMHGAALLYNLALSELRRHDPWIEKYRDRLQKWSEELDPSAVRAWSPEDFWGVVDHPGHTIRPAAKRFVTEWRELVLAGPGQVAAAPTARKLVKEREQRLKTTQSRYTNNAVRDRWTGVSGIDRFSYRWTEAKSYLRDLALAEPA